MLLDDLIEADIVPALIEAIITSNDIYPVQALLSLMSNHPSAIQQTCQLSSGLKDYIKSTLSENDGSEADCEVNVLFYFTSIICFQGQVFNRIQNLGNCLFFIF